MTPSHIRLLIVEDSLVAAALLKGIIESSPALSVSAIVRNGVEALEWLAHNEVDMVLMDLFMPRMDGYETTRRIMVSHPLPVLVITAHLEGDLHTHEFKALEAGALDIVAKPHGPLDPLFEKKKRDIINRITCLAGTKMITRGASHASASRPEQQPHVTPTSPGPQLPDYNPPAEWSKTISFLGIAASTGGPQALRSLLSELPADYSLPVGVVQHITPGFLPGLVQWLQEDCKLPISIAEAGQSPEKGHVYFAPDDYHLELDGSHLFRLTDHKNSLYMPSADYFFYSLATFYGSQAAGIILTGMGSDGAQGLKEMHDKGALTIAQDKDSSLIFGMPQAAIMKEAVTYILSLAEIPIKLVSLALQRQYGGHYG